jgi:copper(I)-binding protein
VNRLPNRLFAATAGLAACGVILTGCSSGQISQTADQQSAVNGSSGNVQNIALRNVHLQAVQTGDYLQPGRNVDLIFVAANLSSDTNDKLVSISSDVGAVTVTGDTALPAGASLVVGSPDGQADVTPLGSAQPTQASVALSQPITNGLTYNFTFDFDKAGQTTIAVPISAGGAPRAEAAPAAHG